ncbi:hypothetical protein BMF94_3700 [Rhodotorula taiwanensis]|uniref:VPS37 C-terminal domain-containing protein n=1 Tax=Rhodotorula taiwanensis TaxID=741276 RepID=A0A2S5B9B5_9BASI|nr:hypothetical protein BMF94_3700 [Rhodotorula taiwanensis]
MSSSSSPSAPPRRPALPFSAATTASQTAGPTPTAAGIDDSLARDFPEVAQLSKDELQLLVDDAAYFDAYFHSTPQALNYHAQLEQKLKDNIHLAQESEAMKPALNALRDETARLFHEANDLKQQAAYLTEAQLDAYRRFSQPAQLARYRAATTTQDHLSDSLVAAFLNGQGDDESFVKQYREVRKLFHKREIGLQKWDEGKVVWM